MLLCHNLSGVEKFDHRANVTVIRKWKRATARLSLLAVQKIKGTSTRLPALNSVSSVRPSDELFGQLNVTGFADDDGEDFFYHNRLQLFWFHRIAEPANLRTIAGMDYIGSFACCVCVSPSDRAGRLSSISIEMGSFCCGFMPFQVGARNSISAWRRFRTGTDIEK